MYLANVIVRIALHMLSNHYRNGGRRQVMSNFCSQYGRRAVSIITSTLQSLFKLLWI